MKAVAAERTIRSTRSRGPIRTGRLAFFKEFFRNPAELGTCFTSSKALSRAVTSGVGLESAKTVVEFGPGSGPVTEQILKRIPHGCRFFAIERNEEMAATLKKRFPGLPVYADDALNAPELARREGMEPGKIDCVVSAVPFLWLPDNVQEQLLIVARDLLRPGGTFSMLTYGIEEILPAARRFRKLLNRTFPDVRRRIVFGNVPPAATYLCRIPG